MSEPYQSYTVDSQTGEVVNNNTAIIPVSQMTVQQRAGYGAFLSVIERYGVDATEVMAHKLAELGLESHAASDLLSIYKSDVVDKIETHLNEPLVILGATIDYHSDFQAKDQQFKEGYFYMLLRTDKEKAKFIPIGDDGITVKRPLLIRVTAREIVRYFLAKMESDSWFDFKTPVRCFFSGTQTSGYTISTFSEKEYGLITELMNKKKM